MNVLFVCSLNDIQSPAKPLQNPKEILLGISYISSLLKGHGHNTKLIVLSGTLSRRNKETIETSLKEFSPKLICFTAVATEYPLIACIARYIKNNYRDIFLLIGGPHASLNPQEVILDSFDALCIGEGEYPTLELVWKLEKSEVPSGIANLWIKNGSEIEKKPTRPFLRDLDSLPFPDRQMWRDWIRQPQSVHSVLLGRGCPFQCTYCSNSALSKLAPGTYVRFRSPDNVVEEIHEILREFQTTREIYLEVETIAANRRWALDLCSKLESLNKKLSQPLSFGVNLRVTSNADMAELFAAFERSNFRLVNIGLESGSERVRHDILKRDYSNQDIINVVKLAKKHGLEVVLYNMMGFPGETLADFKETVKLNRICLPDGSNTSIFFPYPGTDLHSLCMEQGLLSGVLDMEMERRKAVLDLPGFSRKQIQSSYTWFAYYVYRRHKPMYKILARVLRAKIESNYYLNRLYRATTRFFSVRRLINVLKI